MFEKVAAIVGKYSGVSAGEITEDTNLLSDLHMESMNFIDMICEFESAFSRDIPERDFRRFITVRKIIAYLGKDGVESHAGGQSADSETVGFKPSHCIVAPMTGRLAEKIPALVKSVYGMGYPAQYLYNPEEFQAKADSGEIYPYVAINGEGKATGMISLIRLSVNPGSFELGQLMVAPEYRGTDVAELLISCISGQELKFGVIYSESVTNHKFSQRSCAAGGFNDVALKLNIMPPFGADSADSGRISCVVSCIERGESKIWAYVPADYKDAVSHALSGLSARIFRNASATAPDNPTVYSVNDSELSTTKYVNVTFMEIGSDAAISVENLNLYAAANGVKSLIVNVPLACPHNGALVAALQKGGFAFGGVMPRWYADSDSLLMQRVYREPVDWDAMKLFSEKINAMAEFIKEDMERNGA